MLSLVSQFVLNGIILSLVISMHLVIASVLLSTLRERYPSSERLSPSRWWGWAVVVILILDLPLAYTLLLYKAWHPMIADRIMYVIRYPWMLLQFNTLLLGIILLGYRHVYRRFIRHQRVPEDAARTDRPAVSVAGTGAERPSGDRPDVLHSGNDIVAPGPYDSMNSLTNDYMNKQSDSHLPASGNSRRQFIRTAALATGGIALNGSLLALAGEGGSDVVERRRIRIPNLPDALKGTTIGMISDIHSSMFMSRRRMEHYVRILDSLKADVIVIPGDFVNSKVREVYPLGEAFSGLSAPLGVYGVTGNHDYYAGDIRTIAGEVEQTGIKLLRNENVRLEKNGVGFRLLGMDDDAIYDVRQYIKDGKTEQGRIEHALKGIADDEPTVLLSHKPYPFEEYARLGIDLTLSGHTHGGQIVLASIDKLNVSVASLASTYISGLYKAHSNPASQMYISRGIGTAGIPIRFNCPPEVTHITLV